MDREEKYNWISGMVNFFLAGWGGMPYGAKNRDADLYGPGQRPVMCEYGTKLSYTAII